MPFLTRIEALGDERSISTWPGARAISFLNELGWQEFEEGCLLRYYPNSNNLVHNSSMIGASLLARVNSIAGTEPALSRHRRTGHSIHASSPDRRRRLVLRRR